MPAEQISLKPLTEASVQFVRPASKLPFFTRLVQPATGAGVGVTGATGVRVGVAVGETLPPPAGIKPM